MRQEYQKTILNNGMRLITSPMPHTRSVSINFFIGTGSRYEKDAQAGISHFIEHMCFKGTDTRPNAGEIAAAIEGVGGILNAATDKELTVYWCKVAEPHFLFALSVMTDLLLNSQFAPDEIEKERQVIVEEINMTDDSPSQRSAMLIDELLWPGHPLGRDIAGTRKSVSAISREMMLAYMKEQYQAAATVISIAGDIQHEATVNAVTQALSGWNNGRAHPAYLPYTAQTGQQVKIETRETEQTHLCLAMPGLPLLHPRRHALDLLNIILGEGMSSRLFTEIRDNLGLAYNINSYVDHFLDTGSLIITAGVDKDSLTTAIKAILEELSKLKGAIGEEEIHKAKEYAKGRILLRMESSHNVAGWLGAQEVLTGRIRNVDQVIEIIDAVTAEELRQLATELLRGEQLRLAVVGPVSPDTPLKELLKL